MSPIKFPKNLLKHLLEICTTEAPFYSPTGKLYKQIDGIAMGSLLGVLFANFYLGHLEKETFNTHPHLKPHLYTRYVDDIFIAYDNISSINDLLNIFNRSKLKFTIEYEKDNTLHFLDVTVKHDDDNFSISVYVKNCNKGICLNGKSECTKQYKMSTIKSFIN